MNRLTLLAALCALFFALPARVDSSANAADDPLGKQSWGRIVQQKNTLELHVDTVPDDRNLLIPRLNNRLKKLSLKGGPDEAELSFRPLIDQWQITLPKSLATDANPIVVFETFEPIHVPVKPRVVAQLDTGAVELPAHESVTHGRLLRYEPQPHKNTVGYWADAKDWVEWHVSITEPGQFSVDVFQGCGKGQGGSVIEISVGDSKTSLTIEDTGHFQNFKRRTAGVIEIPKAGDYQLQIRPVTKAKNAVCDIRKVWLVPVSATKVTPTEQLLYLASATDKRIDVYALAAESGKLTKQSSVDLPGNAGPMSQSPDGSLIYAAMTRRDASNKQVAEVATLKRAEDGSLKIIGTGTISSRAPYIRADRSGTVMLAAHYGPGEVTAYRIKDGICTSEMTYQQKTAATAHCIEVDPSGKFVYVPHTSPNKVFQFELNAKSGKLIPLDPPSVSGPDTEHKYHAPRHYAHHPTLNMAYTSNESGGGISAWEFDPKSGHLKLVQTLSALPPDFEGNSAAADIHVTPNGRFAYVSNRDVTRYDDPKQAKDTLAGFSLDAKTGRMTLVGYYPTISFPRSFTLDVVGKYAYAAGQRSNNLAAYRINQDTGALDRIATYDCGAGPIWVMCVTR